MVQRRRMIRRCTSDPVPRQSLDRMVRNAVPAPNADFSQGTDTLRSAFDIPAGSTPIGAIALGHPAPDEGTRGSVSRKKRKPMQDVIHYGRWS